MKRKIKKDKQPGLYKRWYALCEPNKTVWFWQILTYILFAAFYSALTIFAAKTIDCLYQREFKQALFWLVMELASIVIRSVFIHIQYHFYTKHYGIIRLNITRKIYDKILTVEDSGISTFSSDKIINIAQNNMAYACEFPDYIAGIIRYVIQAGIGIVTIFTINIFAGLVVVALGVVNFIFYKYMNRRLGRIMNDRFAKKDRSFQEYSKIITGKPVIEEMEESDQFKTELLDHVSDFNSSFAKYQRVLCFRDSVHWALWNVVVYAITAVLILLISRNVFEISLYLIIVPYLKSCTEELNELYKKFGGFENVRVDVDRINTILSLTDKQLLTYGDKQIGSSEANELRLIGVCYNSRNSKVCLKNVDINFAMNTVNIVKGGRECGKRIVFDLLRRKVKPDSGKVLLDNLDLYEYNLRTFKNHIDYCSSHPIFIRGTVKENLLVSNNSFKKIQDLVKELGLESVIDRLEKGYNTNIEDVKDGEIRFWIGFIRAALKQSRILIIYEYPDDVSPDFHETLKKIIETSEKKKRTIIFFTHKNNYDHLADAVFEFKDGELISKEEKE